MPGPRPATTQDKLAKLKADWKWFRAKGGGHIGVNESGMQSLEKLNAALDFQIRIFELILEKLGD